MKKAISIRYMDKTTIIFFRCFIPLLNRTRIIKNKWKNEKNVVFSGFELYFSNSYRRSQNCLIRHQIIYRRSLFLIREKGLFVLRTIGLVEENSVTWNDYAESSDMIFLGNVNQEMINKSELQGSFCGSINEKLGDKALFASMESTVLRKPSLEGCA